MNFIYALLYIFLYCSLGLMVAMVCDYFEFDGLKFNYNDYLKTIVLWPAVLVTLFILHVPFHKVIRPFMNIVENLKKRKKSK